MIRALVQRTFGAVRCERGQVLPLAVGAVAVLLVLIAGLGGVGAAIVAKGRAQRAADLSAISAATVLDEERWRAGLAPRLNDGRHNPMYLSRFELAGLVRAAAGTAAERNGVPATALRVELIAYRDWLPNRVEVTIAATAELPAREQAPVEARAIAEAVPDPAPGGSAIATGGGYSGPLEIRQGEGMRPDVAVAFDRMAAAAARAGQPLALTSGFRSDAEQAVLFAQNPDPRWVAPPGQSLHRCATELDIGPPSVYGWLAANAPRFRLRPAVQLGALALSARRRPRAMLGGSCRPGSGAGRRRPARLGCRRNTGRRSCARRRATVSRRACSPRSSRPSRALTRLPSHRPAPRGIAQFMPATAASVGLADPFDPEQAIDAQGRLMAQLIAQFGSETLALAAYNAGPGAVAACGCVPPYPETRAYVAQISGLVAQGGSETGAWRRARPCTWSPEPGSGRGDARPALASPEIEKTAGLPSLQQGG